MSYFIFYQFYFIPMKYVTLVYHLGKKLFKIFGKTSFRIEALQLAR